MLETPTYIQNYQSIVDAFGHWPNFHDSTVLNFSVSSDVIELELASWEITPEVDSTGELLLSKRYNVGFKFTELVCLDLSEFIAKNILFSLDFSSLDDQRKYGHFTVVLDEVLGAGLSGRFDAKIGTVTLGASV